MRERDPRSGCRDHWTRGQVDFRIEACPRWASGRSAPARNLRRRRDPLAARGERQRRAVHMDAPRGGPRLARGSAVTRAPLCSTSSGVRFRNDRAPQAARATGEASARTGPDLAVPPDRATAVRPAAARARAARQVACTAALLLAACSGSATTAATPAVSPEAARRCPVCPAPSDAPAAPDAITARPAPGRPRDAAHATGHGTPRGSGARRSARPLWPARARTSARRARTRRPARACP